MATLQSYDLKGKKLSFANWISNLSPTDTPFVSMTKKEAIQQTLFSWQTDRLAKVAKNAVVEGSKATDASLTSTTEISNNTQILRKALKVSDTSDSIDTYGRSKELQYQMEKAGKEIKRDLENALLQNGVAVPGSSSAARETAGFKGLVAAIDAADVDTGAIVHKKTKAPGVVTEAQLFDMTYNLYLAGSRANIIMYHPKYASFFSSLMETASQTQSRVHMFDGMDTKFNLFVATIVDPLGQEYRLIPNRFMKDSDIFFLNPEDWTQMVLREPSRTKLAKTGSAEKWMIEMEVGLRHRDPFASGVLELIA